MAARRHRHHGGRGRRAARHHRHHHRACTDSGGGGRGPGGGRGRRADGHVCAGASVALPTLWIPSRAPGARPRIGRREGRRARAAPQAQAVRRGARCRLR
eukprot:scaffold15616_cov33-Phaeocystis_antarctica.AAC.1